MNTVSDIVALAKIQGFKIRKVVIAKADAKQEALRGIINSSSEIPEAKFLINQEYPVHYATTNSKTSFVEVDLTSLQNSLTVRPSEALVTAIDMFEVLGAKPSKLILGANHFHMFKLGHIGTVTDFRLRTTFRKIGYYKDIEIRHIYRLSYSALQFNVKYPR